MKVAVPQAQIKRLFATGKSQTAIATQLHLPRTVVRRVIGGKDVPYYSPKLRGTSKDLCECCGVGKKGEGKRFLCDFCFKYAENQIYPECSLNI